MQSERLIAHYGPAQNPSTLSQLARDLLAQQKTAWPQLAAGYRTLETLQVRELQCEGFSVRLQFNPQRVVSTGANVEAQAIQARPCFLCQENLPEPQKGILYRDAFLLLCNPAPIFPQHYTISHLQHRPQALAEHFETLLQLAKDFSPHFSVFYNGPKCGASAPDHLHFQACPANAIPIASQIHEPGRRMLVKNVLGVAIHKTQKLGREILLLTGCDAEALVLAFLRAIAAMREVMLGPDEPMMNVICSCEEELYQALIFPRRRHRPAVYFREPGERILISPASVDMGGLIITPIEKDFLAVEAQVIENIYQEVSLTPEATRQIIARI